MARLLSYCPSKCCWRHKGRAVAIAVGLVMLLCNEAAAQSWSRIGTIESARSIDNLDFVDARHGFAFDQTGDIYRSDDGGRTWIMTARGIAESGLQIRFFNSLEGVVVRWLPDPPLSATLAVYRTGDAGETWSLVYEDRDTVPFAPFVWDAAVNGSDRLALSGYGAVYTTQDRGVTWRRRNVFSPGQSHVVEEWVGVAYVGNRLWVCGAKTKTVLASDDNGDSWRRIVVAGEDWTAIAVAGDDRVCVTASGALYWSENNGLDWHVTRANRDSFPGAVFDRVKITSSMDAVVGALAYAFRRAPSGALSDERVPIAAGQRVDYLTCLPNGMCWVVNRYTGEVFQRSVASGAIVEVSNEPDGRMLFDMRSQRLVFRSSAPDARVRVWSLNGECLVDQTVVRSRLFDAVDLTGLPAGVYVATCEQAALVFYHP